MSMRRMSIPTLRIVVKVGDVVGFADKRKMPEVIAIARKPKWWARNTLLQNFGWAVIEFLAEVSDFQAIIFNDMIPVDPKNPVTDGPLYVKENKRKYRMMSYSDVIAAGDRLQGKVYQAI